MVINKINEKKAKTLAISISVIFLIIFFLGHICNIKIGDERYFIMCKEVEISNNTGFDEAELKRLAYFPLLEEVWYDNSNMSDIDWISGLNPRVKECHVSGSGINKINIEALNDTSIEYISFGRLNIDDFTDIDGNSTIRMIFTVMVYDGVSLDGIENFKALEDLCLANAHNLTNCDALKECSELKEVTIIQCDNPIDFSCVLEMPKLEYLCVDDGALQKEVISALKDKGVRISFYKGS